jgi:hypothetical protein
MRRERSLLIFLAVLSLSLIGYTIVNNYLDSRSQIITWAVDPGIQLELSESGHIVNITKQCP